MNRIVSVITITLGTVVLAAFPAAAVPLVTPEVGGVTVTANYEDLTQTIVAGTIAEETDNELPGLCAVGDAHTSCTPADEAAE
jgi:hypothetical protein